jgi:signal transduction histidine kinase
VLGDVVRAALTALPVLPVIEATLDGTLEVDGVATELQRLTTELLQNAREAVGTDAPPHRVTVSLSREGAWAVLVVTDAGPGIPAALLPQLFSPFASRKSATGRRGLGLPLANAIVGRHQGTLRVESSEGKGTRCEVRLPLATPA